MRSMKVNLVSPHARAHCCLISPSSAVSSRPTPKPASLVNRIVMTSDVAEFVGDTGLYRGFEADVLYRQQPTQGEPSLPIASCVRDV